MNTYEYQVGGSLKLDSPSYIVRQADLDLLNGLLAGELCYVFNTRQMGKSSLRVRIRHQLEQAGMFCAALDMTRIGCQQISPQQWYKSIAVEILRTLHLLGTIDLQAWWQEYSEISEVQRLALFLDRLLTQVFPRDRLFIFVDEIDSAFNLPFGTHDFWGLIRACYNQRAENPAYQRLTWSLFGVATPAALIRHHPLTAVPALDLEHPGFPGAAPPSAPSSELLRSEALSSGPLHPVTFNIGRAIQLSGFQSYEAQPLVTGLIGCISSAQAVLQAILTWTGGQPFLTQKLCQLVVQTCRASQTGFINLRPQEIAPWVAELVRSRLIERWESQDEPEHLRTIRDRILANPALVSRNLALYRQILLGDPPVLHDNSPEQTELILSGLVEDHRNQLRIKNPIYQAVFDQAWLERSRNLLRPYATQLHQWLQSQDPQDLLQGDRLQVALAWSHGKRLSPEDYEFLLASQAQQLAQHTQHLNPPE